MINMIYQVYVGQKSALYYHCIESVANYCKKYGIDHIVQKEPILKIKPDLNSTNRSMQSYERFGYLPIYEKENAFSYLDRYDNIAIIDADIFIKEDAPNIFEEINDYEFAGVVEREMPITQKYRDKIKSYSIGQYKQLSDVDWKWDSSGAEFINMGVMLFSNNLSKYLKNETPEQFIRRKEFKRFVDGLGNWKWSTDQTMLNYWIKKEKMKVKNLSFKWNALYTAINDKDLKNAYFVHFFLKDHLPNKGENIEQLLASIKE